MERSKEILVEYMALLNTAKKPMAMAKEVPWKQFDQAKEKSLNDPVVKQMMESPNSAANLMDAIAANNVEVFHQKLAQEINAVNASNAPKLSVSMQPGTLNERNQQEQEIRAENFAKASKALSVPTEMQPGTKDEREQQEREYIQGPGL